MPCRHVLPLVLALACASLFSATAQAAEHRLGIGVQFWRTVDDLKDQGFTDIKEDGFAGVLSYQYIPPSLLRFEIDLEIYDDGFGGSDETAVSPIGFVLVGNTIYVGIGVGLTFSSGFEDEVSDPFLAGRLGFQLSLLPGVRLDINANYRTDTFSELANADTDTITLGALVRFAL